MRRLALALLAALAGAALAADRDARGWHAGEPAANAARMLEPIGDEPVVVDLPRPIAKAVRGPTLLVYVSPSCPHCIAIAPEIAALAARKPELTVIGVGSSRSSADALASFATTHGWTFRVEHDADGAITAAMGARSTPSALLVTRTGTDVVAVDLWYPYALGSDVLVEMRAAESPWSVFTPGRYLGNRACGACHAAEQESWALSHHSVAWRTLVKQEATDDPSCVGCHVTGHGQPGGWDGTASSPLTDVGCESCHSAGGPHDGAAVVPATTCEGCHDSKHSINFSYAKGLPLLDHYKTTELDGEALRVARRALLDGNVPRDLLAFGDGKTVGAEACKSCHEAEHAAWKGSGHAGAMARLKDQASDVACVRCHATGVASGLPSGELAGYRTDEGVGCESCHGPGEAHVASGAKADIVGLGESCPVCVIEAICTSCHTPDQDADWDLDVALPRVSHTPAEVPASTD